MESLRKQLAGLVHDGRIGAVHVSVYVALLQCKEAQGGTEPLFICRKEVMRLARIQGRTTYYKILKELDAWGYIAYIRGWGARGESQVRLSLLEAGSLGEKRREEAEVCNWRNSTNI